MLPRVRSLGYNALQLMAIMEHPYYGSFGYQVTSFFAVSSRFGTPEDLKRLIDEAHGLGMVVFLDLVHSHASNNALDGINEYDGTDHCFFHSLPKGKHPQWDSRLFNYGNWEVLRFLLSNVRFWMTEMRFDGFRYDGVTSMLYVHHGIGTAFVNGYGDYFGNLPGSEDTPTVDEDAFVYLALSNDLVHSLGGVTIAEDVSGYPGIARPISEGGMGFDYRLNMAIPDKWIELLKHKRDEEWDMGAIVHTCTNRRAGEMHIAYSESHDQSLVGDKTLMMWLADALLYTHMSVLAPPSLGIDRAVALHKMIVSISWVLGGEGLLNFCGNEFGHPEWVDFPRVGNNESYHYARRQWSLAADPLLRYGALQRWNSQLLSLDEKYQWLNRGREYVTLAHEEKKLIVAERPVGRLLWAWNFHSTDSYEALTLPVTCPGTRWRVVASSDDAQQFAGHDRAKAGPTVYGGQQQPHPIVYLPNRTVLVLEAVTEEAK